MLSEGFAGGTALVILRQNPHEPCFWSTVSSTSLSTAIHAILYPRKMLTKSEENTL